MSNWVKYKLARTLLVSPESLEKKIYQYLITYGLKIWFANNAYRVQKYEAHKLAKYLFKNL